MRQITREEEALLDLGLRLLDAERWSDARALFEGFVVLRRDHPGGWFGLGRAYAGARQWKPALDAFSIAVELDGRDAHLLELGLVLVQVGRTVEASSVLRKIDRESAEGARAHLLLRRLDRVHVQAPTGPKMAE